MKKLKNMSIHLKIFFYLIGFSGVLLILLWLLQIVFLDNFYKSIKINEIKNTASVLEKNIDNESFEEICNTLSENKGICVSILSDSGEEIYSVEMLRGCTIHRLTISEKLDIIKRIDEAGGSLLEDLKRPQQPEWKDDAEKWRQFTEAFTKKNTKEDKVETEGQPQHEITKVIKLDQKALEQTIIHANKVTKANGDIVYIALNSQMFPLNATVETLRIQLFYVTGFMILFSLILAYVISRNVSKPIEKINNSARLLALGKYNTEFEGSGYKEIKELSDTLNYTATELSKVEGLRRELIANISHDLRTPLTLISGYAEAMRDLPNENNQENAQIIVDETNRLTSLVNDVLDLSKYQMDGQQLHSEKYSITNSIKGTVNRMNELLKKDGYIIKFSQSEDIEVMADELKISQALYNLMINAVNYSGKDKTIIVRQIRENDTVRIEVVDMGEGISKESLPYIWDRYYKCDKDHKRAVTGTGLGLSIVRSVIEIHGGEYGVSSTFGEGSVFWFKIKAL